LNIATISAAEIIVIFPNRSVFVMSPFGPSYLYMAPCASNLMLIPSGDPPFIRVKMTIMFGIIITPLPEACPSRNSP
jgi:hypothetical protein